MRMTGDIIRRWAGERPEVDALAEIGIAIHSLRLFNKHGQLIFSEPRGLAAGYRWPQFSVHRGALQMLLLKEVRRRIGRDRL